MYVSMLYAILFPFQRRLHFCVSTLNVDLRRWLEPNVRLLIEYLRTIDRCVDLRRDIGVPRWWVAMAVSGDWSTDWRGCRLHDWLLGVFCDGLAGFAPAEVVEFPERVDLDADGHERSSGEENDETEEELDLEASGGWHPETEAEHV